MVLPCNERKNRTNHQWINHYQPPMDWIGPTCLLRGISCKQWIIIPNVSAARVSWGVGMEPSAQVTWSTHNEGMNRSLTLTNWSTNT